MRPARARASRREAPRRCVRGSRARDGDPRGRRGGDGADPRAPPIAPHADPLAAFPRRVAALPRRVSPACARHVGGIPLPLRAASPTRTRVAASPPPPPPTPPTPPSSPTPGAPSANTRAGPASSSPPRPTSSASSSSAAASPRGSARKSPTVCAGRLLGARAAGQEQDAERLEARAADEGP